MYIDLKMLNYGMFYIGWKWNTQKLEKWHIQIESSVINKTKLTWYLCLSLFCIMSLPATRREIGFMLQRKRIELPWRSRRCCVLCSLHQEVNGYSETFPGAPTPGCTVFPECMVNSQTRWQWLNLTYIDSIYVSLLLQIRSKLTLEPHVFGR